MDVIAEGEKHRLIVEYDTDASCPREDWDMLTGFVKIPGRGDSRRLDVPAVHPAPIDVLDAYERFQQLPGWGWEAAVARWAFAFHGIVLEYESSHGGFWFVDPAKFAENWPDLDPASADGRAKQVEVIASEQSVYEKWADGDVYGVIIEKAVDLYELDDFGIATDREAVRIWEHVDSLWGCYLDDTYTAQAVALENFEVPTDLLAEIQPTPPVN